MTNASLIPYRRDAFAHLHWAVESLVELLGLGGWQASQFGKSITAAFRNLRQRDRRSADQERRAFAAIVRLSELYDKRKTGR